MNLKEEINLLLKPLIGEENVKMWWESKNRAFDGMTPDDKFAIDPDAVFKYIKQQYNGSYL